MLMPSYSRKAKQIFAKYFSPADLSSFGRIRMPESVKRPGCLPFGPTWFVPWYRSLPNYRVENRSEMVDMASRPGWPGYFSSPARANAAYGREVEGWWVAGMTDLILQAVRGETLLTRPRWPEPLQNDPEYLQIVEHALQPEREFEMKFERWLDERRKR